MSAENFKDEIRAWTGRDDHSDEVVASFIRMAEENLNRMLRVRKMVEVSTALVNENRIKLPTDWLESEYVRFADGRTFYYKPRDQFFNDDAKDGGSKRSFTITGDFIQFGRYINTSNGTSVEMAFFKKVPPYDGETTWLYEDFYTIYLTACQVASSMYDIEDSRAQELQAFLTGLVETANLDYINSKTSGSPLRLRGRKLG